jgi:hypothetical protein
MPGVIRVLGLAAELSPLEMMNRVRRAIGRVDVALSPAQAVEVRASSLAERLGQREVAEHVVERAVLEHHDDDVLDAVKAPRGLVVGRRYPSRRRGGGRAR